MTLGYLGAVHARRGEIDQACATWSTALDVMEGVHSARARQAVVDMRTALSTFVHGTPVLDIKPWFREFGPRGTVRQAPWSTEMLTEYFATPPQDS